MSSSPIKSTIAKINAAEGISPAYRQAESEIAAEDAVIDIAAMAMKMARLRGKPSLGIPLVAMFDDRVKRQARRLLLAAAMHLYGVNALNVRTILGSLSSIDLASADNHEAMAECWQRIADVALEQERECREYAGDEP